MRRCSLVKCNGCVLEEDAPIPARRRVGDMGQLRHRYANCSREIKWQIDEQLSFHVCKEVQMLTPCVQGGLEAGPGTKSISIPVGSSAILFGDSQEAYISC